MSRVARDKIIKTQGELARALGVSARTIRDWGGEGMPRRADGTYGLRACEAWLEERGDRRKTPKTLGETDDEGVESEWLEEGRKWKAKQEKLKYLHRSKELVESATVRDWLHRFAGLLRGFGDRLSREKPELQDDLNRLLDQAADMLEEQIANDGPGDGDEEDDPDQA